MKSYVGKWRCFWHVQMFSLMLPTKSKTGTHSSRMYVSSSFYQCSRHRHIDVVQTNTCKHTWSLLWTSMCQALLDTHASAQTRAEACRVTVRVIQNRHTVLHMTYLVQDFTQTPWACELTCLAKVFKITAMQSEFPSIDTMPMFF